MEPEALSGFINAEQQDIAALRSGQVTELSSYDDDAEPGAMIYRYRRRRTVRLAMLQHFATSSASVSKAWMLTFSDLILLMLTVFVLLFFMSDMNVDNWQNITDTAPRAPDPKVEKEKPVFKASALPEIKRALLARRADIIVFPSGGAL